MGTAQILELDLSHSHNHVGSSYYINTDHSYNTCCANPFFFFQFLSSFFFFLHSSVIFSNHTGILTKFACCIKTFTLPIFSESHKQFLLCSHVWQTLVYITPHSHSFPIKFFQEVQNSLIPRTTLAVLMPFTSCTITFFKHKNNPSKSNCIHTVFFTIHSKNHTDFFFCVGCDGHAKSSGQWLLGSPPSTVVQHNKDNSYYVHMEYRYWFTPLA